MQVFVLIKDERDYNGDRTVFGVYPSFDAAAAVADWEAQKARDWINTMRETGDSVGDWVPSFYVEATTFHND